MTSGSIRLERPTPELARIILDHPARRNAISVTMWGELKAIARSLTDDPMLRVVHLRGEGEEAFAAGADISQFGTERSPERAKEFDARTEAALRALYDLPVPVIAEITGYCIGAGVSIALCSDIRIADDTALFGVPPARLGVAYPPDSLIRLVDEIGATHTKALIFSASLVDANTALRIGLATEVVSRHDRAGRVDSLITTYLANAPLTLRATKQATRLLSHRTVTQELRDQLDALSERCVMSDDYSEGTRAFLDKRPPSFQGH
jgi:enoyl-CoA hydratase/carnithine racemase